MFRNVISAAIISLILVSTVQAQTYMSERGFAEFTSSVPMHTFSGSSEYLVGQIDFVERTVDFYIDLTTLETGNKKRDKDMFITLETRDYPFAEFFGTLVSDFDLTTNEPQLVEVSGEFKMHGVTREVEVEGTLQVMPEGLRVEASWQLNLNDYKIVPPRLLIMKVDEIQEIRIEAVLEPVNS